MEEILGIEALDFGFGIGQPLTHQAAIQELKNQTEMRRTFIDWLQSIHTSSVKSHPVTIREKPSVRGNGSIPILQQFSYVDVESKIEHEITGEDDELIHMDQADELKHLN